MQVIAQQSLDAYMPVVILIVIGIGLVFGALLVGHFIRPSHPTKLKLTAYECGEEPVGSAWSQFNVRFYVVGLIFIIFDVESVLMFPAAAVYKKMNSVGLGGVALVVFILFISILLEGIVYCWKKGDLDWVRSFQKSLGPVQGGIQGATKSERKSL